MGNTSSSTANIDKPLIDSLTSISANLDNNEIEKGNNDLKEILKNLNKTLADNKSKEDNELTNDSESNIVKQLTSVNQSKPLEDTAKFTIEIFGSDEPNGKGFFINDYRINTTNLEGTSFSADDQVKYFFKNLIGYIENNNLPLEEQKDKKNFFHSYEDNVVIKLLKNVDELQSPIQGGKRKKRSRNRKKKSKHRKTKKH